LSCEVEVSAIRAKGSKILRRSTVRIGSHHITFWLRPQLNGTTSSSPAWRDEGCVFVTADQLARFRTSGNTLHGREDICPRPGGSGTRVAGERQG